MAAWPRSQSPVRMDVDRSSDVLVSAASDDAAMIFPRPTALLEVIESRAPPVNHGDSRAGTTHN